MENILSWIYPSKSESNNNSSINEELVKPSIDILNIYTSIFDIVVKRISNNVVTFVNKKNNEYFSISSYGRWNAEDKIVYPDWYINELFYPQRRILDDFVKWLIKHGMKVEIVNFQYQDGNNGSCIQISCGNLTDNVVTKIYIYIDENYNIRIEYKLK